ncbi:MAG: 2-C-methyl-D-erythritol 2,4-cyclodiphosphate synthase [Gammaproteobacteria bacterium]|nr:2-C-methyl-D-erythritol 2,4-cyclodiphosphate synthase [Gammaproteobacteria bacterium]MYJ52394.1 2-C-methyl-D-erythritol 2,4-cyclodiphosphate synthase [Gammaproteobacteria bacterium]
MRVGIGVDAHALVEGCKLILGGVEIDWHKGLEGHSDGDALLHAICDALLGAAAKGDIGRYFPSSDQSLKNIDSRILLRRVKEMLDANGWKIVNIDAVIVAQRPRLSGYIPEMVAIIAEDAGLPESSVNVKATSTDSLGFTGREEGIAAQAVAMIAPAGT